MSGRSTYLFVLPWSLTHIGGVNEVVANLAEEMSRRGSFDPLVLVADWNASKPRYGFERGIPTVHWRIRPYPDSLHPKEIVAYLVWLWRFQTDFARFIRKQRVRVINIHYANPVAHTLWRAARRLSKSIRFFVSFHGSDLTTIERAGQSTIQRWRQLLLDSDATIACSTAFARRLTQVFSGSVRPLVIHNGLSTTEFTSMAERVDGETLPRRYLLSVGKFVKKKGQDTLLRAFALLASEYPDLDLILVGARDMALPQLEQMCASDGRLAGRVHFRVDVPRARIASLFKNAEMFVLPSLEESFGIVILEAGAFALPVVASSVGGIPEIITDGVTGRLVPPADPDCLAHALRTLLRNRSESATLGERLRTRVNSEFAWTHAHDCYVRAANVAQMR